MVQSGTASSHLMARNGAGSEEEPVSSLKTGSFKARVVQDIHATCIYVKTPNFKPQRALIDALSCSPMNSISLEMSLIQTPRGVYIPSARRNPAPAFRRRIFEGLA
jgi:hypothetical protein